MVQNGDKGANVTTSNEHSLFAYFEMMNHSSMLIENNNEQFKILKYSERVCQKYGLLQMYWLWKLSSAYLHDEPLKY